MKRLLFPLLAALALPTTSIAGYLSDIDLMTDETRIKLYLDSATKTPNIIGDLKPAELWIRCNIKNQKTQKVQAFVTTPTYNADNEKVGLRWDSGTPVVERWQKSTDSSSLFVKNPKEFIKKLYESNTLVFQWKPYSTIAAAVKFDLEEIKEDITKARENGCDF